MTEAVAELEKPVEAAPEGAEAQQQTDAVTGQVEANPAPEAGAPEAEADKPKEKSSPWGDDWRDRIAEGGGKDADDLRKLVNKYGSPSGVAKALLAAQREISTRGLAKPKPADPSDEKAMEEWRKSVGIPADPTGYKLPEEVTKRLVDEDKPILAQFTEFAHKKGLTPDAVAGATEWYVELQESAAEAQKAKDAEDAEKCADLLSGEWSRAELKGNRNLAVRYLESSPLGPEGWGLMRKPDGTLLANDPEFMKWASDQGRQMFGDATFASPDAEARHSSRLEEITSIMKTDNARYWREKLNVEHLALLEKEQSRKR